MEQTSQELGRPTEGEGWEEHKLHFGQVETRDGDLEGGIRLQ